MARFSAALLLALVGSAAAFAPSSQQGSRVNTALSAEKPQDGGKKFAAAAVASAYLLSGLVVGADAALADTYASAPSFGGDSSTVLLSARSGGRAGGRAGGGGVSSRAGGAYGGAAQRSTAQSRSASTTIVRPTTVIQSGPAVVAPPVGYGYGYSPYGYGGPGLGLSLGINAIGAIGEGMREARQEGEIARSKAELNAVRQREADMEARMRMMEQQQMMNQQQMSQQQMMQMQMQAQQQK